MPTASALLQIERQRSQDLLAENTRLKRQVAQLTAEAAAPGAAAVTAQDRASRLACTRKER